ncbi:Ubiquitin fusion degradation protein-like protein [Emericellopsis cladophorae]|uniref:Ubiquitin fusion degradation protein-like protein n=1 Tax=Emericellopsis cladophorae TaxID=2686198 RepID=A0A9Q0BCD1_9HYPO|nr:Ubiquitin fusion degradation protein-like protein [Emericellopsis cladophorae]KAI6778984.1 Ubiquitin fusion degradation protein-like protein [Emericellopsis cladophorae]
MDIDTPAPQLRWSGSFDVISPAAISSKNLRGDKILLPQSALEQLLAAAPSRTQYTSTFTSRDRFNPYAATSGARSNYDDSQQLPHPLTFRLVNPKNNHVVYTGIREFSAPEGCVGLSAYLLEALGIDEKDTRGSEEGSGFQIAVHAHQLPKGSFVRLRPLEAGYNPDDWKSLLERQLRDGFTTLTRDAILPVLGVQGETFKFLVDKVEPEGNGICVVDTDVEVDIEALDEEQARETLRQIMSKAQPGSTQSTSKGGELDIWKSVQAQVLPGEYVDFTLPSWNRTQPLELELSDVASPDVLDLFVTPRSAQKRGLPRETAHVFGNFDPAIDGTKSITISPTNIEIQDAESLLIAVHAYADPEDSGEQQTPVQFTIRARAAEAKDSTTDSSALNRSMQEHSPHDEQCKNCLQWVPKRTMVLHENFCRRNNIICPQCKSVFKKGSDEWQTHWHCELDEAHGNSTFSKKKHDAIFHGHRQCPSCDFSTNSLSDLARHQTSVCPGKLILCRFCHLEVPQEGDPINPSPEVVLSGMTAHELADGARTTECHLCDKIIRLRDMETHLKHHELDKVSRAKPEICRNANCGRTLHGIGPKGQIGTGTAHGQGPGNDIGLCSICFGPLYVSMHDPDGKAMRRRIERRYLGQLMTGCAKKHCGNEWCKTGRANINLEPKGTTAAAALPLVKPLVNEIADPKAPMYFCVDEANQTRRTVAEMIAAERVWELEWCIAAAEAEKGNPDRMREWLQAWAPRAI